jgi:hypothetical protein
LNFTSSASSRKNLSRSGNTELEDKRGIPSGANPLHNR